MRDAIYILGLVFCLADPVGAGWRPEEPPAEFAGPYEGKLTVRRVPLRGRRGPWVDRGWTHAVIVPVNDNARMLSG